MKSQDIRDQLPAVTALINELYDAIFFGVDPPESTNSPASEVQFDDDFWDQVEEVRDTLEEKLLEVAEAQGGTPDGWEPIDPVYFSPENRDRAQDLGLARK